MDYNNSNNNNYNYNNHANDNNNSANYNPGQKLCGQHALLELLEVKR